MPCFWRPYIQAGDLASHVYNAYLRDLILQGQVSDLVIAPQSNNILGDLLLYAAGRLVGFEHAEQMVVPFAVLLFFWSTFALMSRVSGSRPWRLAPAVAAVAYGFTFAMGFLNFYLSLGFALAAIALLWTTPRIWHYVIAGLLAVLMYTAHPLGLAAFAATLLVVKCRQYLPARMRWLPFVCAAAGVVAAHWLLSRWPSSSGAGASALLLNGFDQVLLYGPAYGWPAAVLLLASFAAIAQGWRSASPALHTALGLWLLGLFAVALLPSAIQLPFFPAPLAYLSVRFTALLAVWLLTAVACTSPRRWHFAAFGAGALLFFALLWRDTGRLDQLEANAAALVSTLPAGARVIATLRPPPNARVCSTVHVVDRACLGHCFTYSNYEPATGQFAIRSLPQSRTAAPLASDIFSMQAGQYRVKETDLPLYQVYQCDANRFDRLCLLPLKAGELNCPNCLARDSGL